MLPTLRHSWDLTPTEAIALQRELATRVELADRFRPLRRICGLDVSYDRGDEWFFAAAVVFSYPKMAIQQVALAKARSPFPYVPGLLSFREIPVVAEALAQIGEPVDLLVCDGQGLAHPRRFGLACHLGVIYDTPSLGLAKSRLIGEADEPGPARGAWTWLRHDGERIGQVVRTRDGVAPLFVSPGHRLTFGAARKLALALCRQWRLPETTRAAHEAVNEFRRHSASTVG
jgi:deoxyribonuclease V